MASKTTVVSITVGVALLALGYVLLRGGKDGGTAGAVKPTPSEIEEEGGSPDELVPVTTPPNETAQSREVVAATPADESSSPVFEPSLAEGLEVRVVHADTREVVPGAEVSVKNVSVKDFATRGRPRRQGGIYVLKKFEHPFVTDETGRVTVPPTDGSLHGSAPGLRGMRIVGADDESPVVLELFPDVPISVQVVDSFGVPLEGIPVRFTGRGGTVHTRTPNGIAVFEHAILAARIDRETDVRVSLDMGFREEVEYPIDLVNPPSEPIVLVAPPLGRLDIHAVDVRGRAISEEVSVTIAKIEKSDVEAENLGPMERMSRELGRNRPIAVHHIPADGESVKALVEVGFEYEVSASTPSGLGPSSERILGPTQPGDTVPVRIVVAPECPVLVGRIVDAEGTPLASRRFRVNLRTSGFGHSFGITNDEEGRFEVVMRDSSGREDRRRSLTISMDADGGDQGEVRVDLSHVLTVGENDLGDLVLAKLPLLVSGKVTVETGAPVPSTRVDVVRLQRAHRSSGFEFTGIPTRLRATSDGEGNFEIHGAGDEGPYAVYASHEDYAESKVVMFDPQDSDVVLVIQRAGAIAGRVLYEDRGGGQPFRIEVHNEADGNEKQIVQVWKSLRSDPSNVRLDRDGRLEVDRLAPGSYTVKFILPTQRDGWEEPMPGGGDSFFEIREVAVKSGEVTKDPRLAEIDLRDRLRCIILTVLDSEDQRVENTTARYRSPRIPGDEYYLAPTRINPRISSSSDFKPPEGELWLYALDGGVDVDVLARGFRTKHLVGVVADETVVLNAGLPVRVVLADRQARPPSEYALGVSLSQNENEEFFLGMQASMDGDGEALLHLPEPGHYHVRFTLATARENGRGFTGVAGYVLPDVPPPIEVRDSLTEQDFTVDLSPEAVRSFIDLIKDR